MARTTVALVAGEASGDQLGAGLIEALRERHPWLRFVGVGGPRMAAAGQLQWADYDVLAVMGLVEVLSHLPRLLRLRRSLVQRVLAERPALFVGIDAPDFNLGLEHRVKAAGIPTVHYVSPSIWAWRRGRARRIGRSADSVLCLLPFEPELYAEHGIDAHFVGHPLADALPLEPDRAAARASLGLAADDTVLAVLPGSRRGEVSRLAPAFIEASARILRRRPAIRVVAPMASPACRALFEQALASAPQAPPVRLVDGQASTVLHAADAALLASGTAALEAALCRTPMVVGYKIAALSYFLVQSLKLLKSPWVSLPNALAGEHLVEECLQARCTGSELAAALEPLLAADSPQARRQRQAFQQMHDQLRRNASLQAARVLDRWLRGEP